MQGQNNLAEKITESSLPPIPEYPNLRPWKKGQSGNPEGKPSLVKLLKKYVGELTADGKTNGQKIVENLVSLAQKDDFRATTAAGMVMDRVDGPVKQQIEVKRSFSFDINLLTDGMMGQGILDDEVIDVTDTRGGMQSIGNEPNGKAE